MNIQEIKTKRLRVKISGHKTSTRKAVHVEDSQFERPCTISTVTKIRIVFTANKPSCINYYPHRKLVR